MIKYSFMINFFVKLLLIISNTKKLTWTDVIISYDGELAINT